MPVKISINGFGRIGRSALRIILKRDDCEVVAINDLASLENLAYLFKYDSVYGKYDEVVSFDEKNLIVGGKKIPYYSEKDPLNLPWKDLDVDVVLECTGVFVKDNAAKVHLEAGAKKVVLSAPAEGDSNDIKTFLKGVNHNEYDGEKVFSNASCTTNCIAPAAAIIHSNFKVLKSAMTTIHAYTAGQNLVDGDHKDMRRGRAAALNIVPTSTGAASATGKVIPELEGIFDGISVRVPVPTGSLSDLTFLVEKKTTVEEVNQAFLDAKENPMYEGVLDASYDPIVSSDVIGNPYSAIVDLPFTRVIDGDLVKILVWYDNEWGYSVRLVEMALLK